jgi:hypothetical protein
LTLFYGSRQVVQMLYQHLVLLVDQLDPNRQILCPLNFFHCLSFSFQAERRG